MQEDPIAERRRKIHAFLQDGVSPEDIPKMLGISRPTIYNDIAFLRDFTIASTFTDFNVLVGLPLHPKTGVPSPMTDYQINLDYLIDVYGWILLNKSKKIGATDSILRSIAMRCFSKYKGGEIMLVAGNRKEHAVSLLDRMKPLFHSKALKDSVMEETQLSISLSNNTIINAYPSNSDALIGRPLVKAIYLDEAAYTGIEYDWPVFNNLYANVSNTRGDFIICSTPNGKRGFFYELCQKHSSNWNYLEINYEPGLKAGILDETVIMEAKEDPRIDFDQLYNCKFTTSMNSVFTDTFSEGDFMCVDMDAILNEVTA